MTEGAIWEGPFEGTSAAPPSPLPPLRRRSSVTVAAAPSPLLPSATAAPSRSSPYSFSTKVSKVTSGGHAKRTGV